MAAGCAPGQTRPATVRGVLPIAARRCRDCDPTPLVQSHGAWGLASQHEVVRVRPGEAARRAVASRAPGRRLAHGAWGLAATARSGCRRRAAVQVHGVLPAAARSGRPTGCARPPGCRAQDGGGKWAPGLICAWAHGARGVGHCGCGSVRSVAGDAGAFWCMGFWLARSDRAPLRHNAARGVASKKGPTQMHADGAWATASAPATVVRCPP
jgi:hypothetical protein